MDMAWFAIAVERAYTSDIGVYELVESSDGSLPVTSGHNALAIRFGQKPIMKAWRALVFRLFCCTHAFFSRYILTPGSEHLARWLRACVLRILACEAERKGRQLIAAR